MIITNIVIIKRLIFILNHLILINLIFHITDTEKIYTHSLLHTVVSLLLNKKLIRIYL